MRICAVALLSVSVFVTSCTDRPRPLDEVKTIRAVAEKLSPVIVESGVFELVGKKSLQKEARAVAGVVGTHGELRHIDDGSEVEVELGKTFGFRYQISGPYSGAMSGFEMRSIHPAMKGPNGQFGITSTAATEMYFEQGVATNEVMYTLHKEFELLPGDWTLQILLHGQVLLSKKFVLRR